MLQERGGAGARDDLGREGIGKGMSMGSSDKEAVLLDVRNVYETSIGHFRCF